MPFALYNNKHFAVPPIEGDPINNFPYVIITFGSPLRNPPAVFVCLFAFDLWRVSIVSLVSPKRRTQESSEIGHIRQTYKPSRHAYLIPYISADGAKHRLVGQIYLNAKNNYIGPSDCYHRSTIANRIYVLYDLDFRTLRIIIRDTHQSSQAVRARRW